MTPKNQMNLDAQRQRFQIELDRIRLATRSAEVERLCDKIELMVYWMMREMMIERLAVSAEGCILIPIACALWAVLGFGLAVLLMK